MKTLREVKPGDNLVKALALRGTYENPVLVTVDEIQDDTYLWVEEHSDYGFGTSGCFKVADGTNPDEPWVRVMTFSEYADATEC